MSILAFAALALSGCAGFDVHEVRDPQSQYSMIRMTVPDLIHCMGTKFTWQQTKPDEGELMWTRTDTSTAFKASIELVGSIELGGGGGCSVSADILRSGTVADIDFPESYNDGLLAEPYHACRPLIIECIGHQGDTGLPKGYDAFLYLAAAKAVPEAKAGP